MIVAKYPSNLSATIDAYFSTPYPVNVYTEHSGCDEAVDALIEALDAWVNDPVRIAEEFRNEHTGKVVHVCLNKFLKYADKLER